MNTNALKQALAAIPERRRLKVCAVLHAARATSTSRRLQARLALIRRLHEAAESGKVTIVFQGRDCDGFQYLYARRDIPATLKSYDYHVDDFDKGADGSFTTQVWSPSAFDKVQD